MTGRTDAALAALALGVVGQFGALMFWGGQITARLANVETHTADVVTRGELEAVRTAAVQRDAVQDERLLAAFERLNTHAAMLAGAD